MNIKKIRATAKAILNILDTQLDWMLIPSKSETIRRLKKIPHANFEEEFLKYYPSSVYQGINTLKRKGLVETRETKEGTEVKITDNGQTELLKYQLNNLRIPNQDPWDGKWRLVFFDIEELNRSKRNRLHSYLTRLGLKPLQRSVFVHPYPCEKEIKFLREVLRVPHSVKLVTAEKIENDEDLRAIFHLD